MNKIKTGVLLLNLGTPLSPHHKDVRAYLKQFLNDPYVIDIPYFFRKLLVDGIILNTRPKKSAEAYEKIWAKEGSPLLINTEQLTHKVKKLLNEKETKVSVKMAMRYGHPSILEAMTEFKNEGIEELIFLPLYPQYSYAASESSIMEFLKIQSQLLPNIKVKTIEDFFSEPDFITALAVSMKPAMKAENPDLLLLSYHGVPERQLLKIKEPSKKCCSPGCCDQWDENNLKCYRAQCYETSRKLAAALDLDPEKVITSFQSRLGRTKWIEPYTDILLQEFPKKGIKKLVVASPSFTADCLETLEEIQIRYQELFFQSGGEKFSYVPCLNSHDDFANFVARMVSI